MRWQAGYWIVKVGWILKAELGCRKGKREGHANSQLLKAERYSVTISCSFVAIMRWRFHNKRSRNHTAKGRNKRPAQVLKYVERTRGAVREQGKADALLEAGTGQAVIAPKSGKDGSSYRRMLWLNGMDFKIKSKERVACSSSDTGTCIEDANSHTPVCRNGTLFSTS